MRYFFKMMIPSVADAAHVTGKTTTKSILLMIEGKRLWNKGIIVECKYIDLPHKRADQNCILAEQYHGNQGWNQSKIWRMLPAFPNVSISLSGQLVKCSSLYNTPMSPIYSDDCRFLVNGTYV